MHTRILKSSLASLSVDDEEADRILGAINEGTELEGKNVSNGGQVVLVEFWCPVLDVPRWAVKSRCRYLDITDFEFRGSAETWFDMRVSDIEQD